MKKNTTQPQSRLILFNKPYEVLSQFTDEAGRATLADYISKKQVYVAGRLDRDSEGLLLLTDNGQLQHQIANPAKKTWKTYIVQVEGAPDDNAVQQLSQGVELKDGLTRPARVRQIEEPEWLWERDPPVRFRKTVPDHWLEIQIQEGKNRQVRRMTAAVGLPTLRLVRSRIGDWTLDHLQPGEYNLLQIAFEGKPANAMDTPRHGRRHHRKKSAVSHGQRKKPQGRNRR
ncbi:MAG: pseudouridine synthase [Gammaproteobacteria bacterium]|nr:pseudouridine synthase [Gammaproteobacteria bacterium]